jgi:spore maturation protein CgeB
LSKGNRDLHTTRSLEIPYAGGLLCAERTEEHEEPYREGVDAVFWSDARECAQICQELLDNPERRRAIAASGAERVCSLKLGNEDIVRNVLGDCGIIMSDLLRTRPITFDGNSPNGEHGKVAMPLNRNNAG